MPRAMYLFQKTGLNPLAAPTNHLIKKGKHTCFWDWLPSSANIRKMECAIHEYAGLAWAWGTVVLEKNIWLLAISRKSL